MQIVKKKFKIVLTMTVVVISVLFLSFIYAQDATISTLNGVEDFISGTDNDTDVSIQAQPERASVEVIKTVLRETPDQTYVGAEVEIIADFENMTAEEIIDATATIDLPAGASLKAYDWNLATQPVNGVGAMLSGKNLDAVPPQLYAYAADDMNNTVEDAMGLIKPFHQVGARLSTNVRSGALYYDMWNPDVTNFYGSSLVEYMQSKNYEVGSHTYHHSHMGLSLYMNSQWIGESTRRYRRGSTWGIVNTPEEQAYEICLGKYWNEIYFDKRMEGFRSPFYQYNIPSGSEIKTKSPLRSDNWKIIGKAGFRYISSVQESPSGWPPQEVGETPLANLDPRCVVPSWPQLCDEVSAAADPELPYADFSHQIHNIAPGTQRINSGSYFRWVSIVDESFMTTFDYATSINALKRYTDRHYTITQTQIPHPYIDGMAGPQQSQSNIPLTFGLTSGYTNDNMNYWQSEGKRNSDWVYEIDQYIKTNYPTAKNVTHKDMIDYYQGKGTIRWVVKMPTTPGDYTFTITPAGSTPVTHTVAVKTNETLYNEVPSRAVNIVNVNQIDASLKNEFTDVVFTVKGKNGQAKLTELDAVITQAASIGMGVYASIEVFEDTDMHTTDTLDYAGNVVSNIAEPTDTSYRTALKQLVQVLSNKNIRGVILKADFPNDSNQGATYGYSDAMTNQFKKYFNPPPSGSNPQDPTSENDPLHWSIYSGAVTGTWQNNDIPWHYYDIRALANTYMQTDDMSNLGADSDGTLIVDWLLCSSTDGSDNNGVSSWDEWEAWGEFRKYIIADFINDIVSTKGAKSAYVIVKGDKGVNKVMENALFGTNTDPVEYADITRRRNVLPDLWNHQKSDNIDGIIYTIDMVTDAHIKECMEVARRVDYWVAKGGNDNRGAMPLNEYRPENDSKIFGANLNTALTPLSSRVLKHASAAVSGKAPAIVILPAPSTPPVNLALNKRAVASASFNSQFVVGNANDGSLSTVWGSGLMNTGTSQWLYIDLGKVSQVESIKIKWFDKYYGTRFQVGASMDLKSWTLTSPMTKNASGDTVIPAGGISTRYIGLLITKANQVAVGISELEIWSE